MKTTKVKFFEALEISAELAGVTKGETVVIKGLLNEKLPIKTKYWLGRLSDKLEAHKKSVEKLRLELIEKHGEKSKDGVLSVPFEKKGKKNPKFDEFHKEYEELLHEELEIEHAEFYLADFESLETEANYREFLKLLEV